MTVYAEEIMRAMDMLAEDDRTVFIGQALAYPGTAMTATVRNVPRAKIIEFPVAEELQMGASIGMALAGFIPVSVYPRWNFVLLAANQLVGHLDKLPLFSDYRPRVIVRVGVGSESPMHPGPQHVGDFTAGFEGMCDSISFVHLDRTEDIVPAYQEALAREGATILVELMDKHHD